MHEIFINDLKSPITRENSLGLSQLDSRQKLISNFAPLAGENVVILVGLRNECSTQSTPFFDGNLNHAELIC